MRFSGRAVPAAACMALAASLCGFSLAGTSRVLRMRIPKLVQGRYDAELILYHRDGAFHHGYTLVPERDNLNHRVDVTPSPPIEFVDEAGKKIDVPESCRGYYSYKNKDFLRYKQQYFAGKIRIRHPWKVEPLGWDGKRLSGVLDTLILAVDEANPPGRCPHSLVYRMKIEAAAKPDGAIEGRCVAWQYDRKDDYYGRDNPKRTLPVSARWDDAFWTPRPGTEFAKGKDWPMAQGPNLTGSAIDCEAELVTTLHDARLVWVAEEQITSGRGGGMSRGGFAMYPYAWQTIGEGGFGAPIVADGKVFLYLYMPDVEAIMARPDTANNPYVRLGLDPRALGSGLGLMRDCVMCFDARTGRTLWQFHAEGHHGGNSGKGGRASTPCFYKGRVYVRGQRGLYCLDAATGTLVWHTSGVKGVGRFGLSGVPAEASVGAVGGTLVLGCLDGERGWRTVGINPDDGSVKWTLTGTTGGAYGNPAWPGNGLPGIFRAEGKEYLVIPRDVPPKKSKGKIRVPETFLLVDPADGKVVWESEALGYNGGQILVEGDIAVGNARRGLLDLKGPEAQRMGDATRVGAARLSLEGAKRLWQSPDIQFRTRRFMNVLHKGIVYTDSRASGFNAIEAATGKVLGHHPHIYTLSHSSHNWTWHVATNDRVITDGVLMFSTADKGFRLLPGRLALDLSGGYAAPTKPAICDGRIFLRLADRLACYDLRRRKEDQANLISITAKRALLGVAPQNDPDMHIIIRERRGRLISAGAKVDRITGGETEYVYGSWAANAQYQKTIPEGLALTDDGLRGRLKLRLGWHYEDWSLDLGRRGDEFRGTYVRKVPPLPKPFPCAGQIEGTEQKRAHGARRIMLYLHKAIMRVGLDSEPQGNVMLLLVCRGDEIVHAWGSMGRVNTATHELDASRLKVAGNAVEGEALLVTHDDRYFDMRGDATRRECRSAGEGGQLAARYTVEAKIADGKVAGTYSGTIGVGWSRCGEAAGRLAPDEVR